MMQDRRVAFRHWQHASRLAWSRSSLCGQIKRATPWIKRRFSW